MSFASYQTMTVPEAGTSNAAPEGTVNLQARVNTGPVSVDGEGNTTNHGPQRVNTADLAPARSGVFASATTKTGAPVMGDLQPDHLIKVGRHEMLVSMAEQLGVISRDGSGKYVEVEGGFEAANNTAPRQQQEATEATEVRFASDHAEHTIADLVGATTPGSQIAVMQELINNGAVSEQTINRAASEAGRAPAAMTEGVGLMMAAFKAQADASVSAHGVEDADGLWQWARANRPNDLKQAMNNHGTMRDPRGYAGIAKEYVASFADTDPGSVLNAQFGGGITARQAGKEVVLNIPGRGEMTYRSALKAGLIKVSGL